MILVLPLAVVAVLADPRPEIAELVLSGDAAAAIQRIEGALAADRVAGERLGLDYLRADQLERAGRLEQAGAAFAEALGSPLLADRARLRLARLKERIGEPGVAADLVATLVAAGDGGPLRAEAVELLHRALVAGGDCRLLDGIRSDRHRGSARRRLALAAAECAERAGDLSAAAGAAAGLLEQATDDALAREAAGLLARATLAGGRTREDRLLLARTAYDHREFELARTLFLESRAAAGATARWWNDGYALARSEFWLGDHAAAAQRFMDLSRAATAVRRGADALFQAGRSLELAGRVDEAAAAFESARAVEPLGGWSGVAQLAALRLQALAGDEEGAEARVRTLASRRAWRTELARGALFLASGRLARGEAKGTEQLLAQARSSGAASDEEVAYWEGRRAEVEGSHARAVVAYLEAVGSDPFDPFARLAAARLADARLAPARRAKASALAASSSVSELRLAALLLGDGEEQGAALRRKVRERLLGEPATAAWLDWAPASVASWPLFSSASRRPEDLLLALGRFDEAAAVVSRWFPPSNPGLAFTGAAALAAAGAHRQALAIVETLFQRLPAAVPIEWVDPALRRQLFPLPFAATVREQASLRGVDPNLLAAVLREESRFDPAAVSPASARGLAQLLASTARRVAADLALPEPLPDDLFQPEVSIALGSGYIAELSERFGGRLPAVVTAYNAGEAQTALWTRYCFTRDEAEYLSKVGFRETRAYLYRVLRSRAHYAALEREESAG